MEDLVKKYTGKIINVKNKAHLIICDHLQYKWQILNIIKKVKNALKSCAIDFSKIWKPVFVFLQRKQEVKV